MPRKNAGTPKKRPKSFWNRHRYFKYVLLGLLAALLLTTLMSAVSNVRSSIRQETLAPFYETKGLQPQGDAGQIVRQEPLGVELDDGTALRVLYRTQHADGSPTFSSGMVFIPNNTNAGLPRPVIAWAHGTLGLGDECTPSRAANPVGNIEWVNSMLQKGWVVTATDYAGFGTPGTQGYLVGGAEAYDVLNSVRAARAIAQAKAGTQFAIWGHSQGGNSALFSANNAKLYAPELQLVGTTASAPAAELVPLLEEQYGTVADWVIGPLIAVSWPAANKDLRAKDILTEQGSKSYEKIAEQCIVKSTIGGLVRNVFRQKFFAKNPIDVPAWRTMAEQQSAPLPEADQPLFIIESKTDKVVLPNTTALYIQQACRRDSNIATLWLDKVSHQDIPDKSSGQVIGWISDRFAGKANGSSCDEPLPFKPAEVPS